MVTLETVEVPGLREAVRREAYVRDTAFLDGLELVCGVEVVPLSLRRLIWLEQAHNGLVVPWEWENDAEAVAHAIALLYFCRPDFRPPVSPVQTFLSSFLAGWREAVFARRFRKHKAHNLVREVDAWLSDALMDSPKGGGSGGIVPPSYAAYPVYVFDLLAEAGFSFTYSEIMDMPLRRLWQFWRVADRRLHRSPLTNPSDALTVAHLEKGAA